MMGKKPSWPYFPYEVPVAKGMRQSQYSWNVLDMRNQSGQRTIARFKSKSHAKWFADVANEKFTRKSEAVTSK